MSRSTKARRIRNYAEEYKKRIAKALAAGKSRAAARGHPTAADLPSSNDSIDRESPLEKALARIKRGQSQRAAAVAERVSVERLRTYQKRNTQSARQGRRWIVSDRRPVSVNVLSEGQLKAVTVPADETSKIGRYWAKVNRFLETNQVTYLELFVGDGVADIESRFVPFETRPNVLRKLDGVGELEFLEIYADVAR